jgi:hypothetical protein
VLAAGRHWALSERRKQNFHSGDCIDEMRGRKINEFFLFSFFFRMMTQQNLDFLTI